MTHNDRDILEVLRFELSFLEDGGYGHSSHTPWHVPAIFEDSPTCPNFCDSARPHPCQSCLMAQFVPEEKRSESVACRFVPLTEQGETLDDFYHSGGQAELEEVLAGWLRRQIARIEEERAVCVKTMAA